MGSLKCPLCCRAEFPTRRALQQHLLDVLDLLKCPTCAKSFTSILGLVQHLSLSSCNVEVGVNFDEHFVTYVDCSSFMKKDKAESRTISQPVKLQERTEPAKQIHVSEAMASCADSVVMLPDDEVATSQDMGVVIECDSEALQGDVICIDFEDSGVVVEGNKIIVDSSKVTQKTPSQTADTDAAKKENVVPKSSENNTHLLQEP